MPTYKYKAKNVEGKEYEETKDFNDKTSLYVAIRKAGSTIVSVEELKEKKNLLSSISFRRGVKLQTKIAFAKNLAVMLDAGLSVSRALAILEKQSKNKRFTLIINNLISSISQGQPLSKSLEAHTDVFSPIFVSMVRAGEESGKLSYSLRVVADQLEKSYLLTKKIKGAMIYPVIVITLMIVIGFLMMVFMVPTLTETFEGLNIALPLPTRIIIGTSDFLVSNLILVIITVVALVVAAFLGLRTEKGKRFKDYLVLRLPIIAPIVQEVNSARTTRTLSSLISSGVDIVAALGIAREVLQNSYYKEVLANAAQSIQKGEQVSAVFIAADKLYPSFVGEMTSVGEETGELSAMFENIADFYEGEVDQKTKDLSTIIEPVLMIIIGVGVGLFAIALLAPTYSLVDVIGSTP